MSKRHYITILWYHWIEIHSCSIILQRTVCNLVLWYTN